MLFGNVIGSNIANILVILGLSVVIVPFSIENDIIKKQIPILLFVTLGFAAIFMDAVTESAQTNTLTRTDGVVLILFFSIFVYYLITLLHHTDKGDLAEPKYKMLKSVIFMLLGLGGIIVSSNIVVDNVAAFAAQLGISQKIISVTIISIGTSLPELVTTVIAAKKGENSMAIGNIVGSNVFNICIVLGLPVIILGEASTLAFTYIDMIVMAFSVLLLWIFSATSRRLRRHEGIIFLLLYCVYGGYILMQ
jgi:cation:H+ antiporter